MENHDKPFKKIIKLKKEFWKLTQKPFYIQHVMFLETL